MTTTLPVLQALLVADHVYQDTTGKFVICGVFDVLAKTDPPAPQDITPEVIDGAPGRGLRIEHLVRAGSPWGYLSLREVHGTKDFVLRYVHLQDNRVLFQTEFTVDCKDPLQTIQARFALPLLPLDVEGTFALELLCGHDLIGSHRIQVRRQAAPGAT